MRLTVSLLACLLFSGGGNAAAADATGFDAQNLSAFIHSMEREHAFDRAELERLFERASLQQAVLQAIAKPAESKPWHEYRRIFLTQARIDGGVEFWRANAGSLEEAVLRFGVDAAIIVAIVGVETAYGHNPGKYRIIDALATLAFNYPQRAPFFRGELENYLLLTRGQHFDPLTLTGSYAGAMGLPQFMPSSYCGYAVDFDGDGTTDIWANAADTIGSVGNYLERHGWIAGAPVTVSAVVDGTRYRSLLDAGMKPGLPFSQAVQLGITPQQAVSGDPQVALIELALTDGAEHWLGFNNFYVITRYNHSPLYAMAVYQLADAIRAIREQRARGEAVGP